MPYGEPQAQETASVYTVQVVYTPTDADVPMTITLDLAAVSDQGVTPTGADQAFQALIDLLTGSGAFTVQYAAGEKRYHVIVPVTAS